MPYFGIEHDFRIAPDGSRYISAPRSQVDEISSAVLKAKLSRPIPLNEYGYGSDSQIGFDALAVVLDLEGFTTFCNHSDEPYLIVPRFIKDFVNWFFHELRSEWLKPAQGDSGRGAHYWLWCRFPILVKFTGDGLLLLWSLRHVDIEGDDEVGNIVWRLRQIANRYGPSFRDAKPAEWNVPRRLRCGIARGQAMRFSDDDAVGKCINLASRLQKVGKAGFAISTQGFALEDCLAPEYREYFVKREVGIRGRDERYHVFVDAKDQSMHADRKT